MSSPIGPIPLELEPQLGEAPRMGMEAPSGASAEKAPAERAPAERGRFAPSTTGPAHPGTLLAALLCWLDARSRGAAVELRLEDLDPERSRSGFARGLQEDLAFLGLDWDRVRVQSEARGDHEAALDRLAEAGVLYPCSCTRARLRQDGEPAPDGGYRYRGHCRDRPLPPGGWRVCRDSLRLRLQDGELSLRDESGMDLGGDPARLFGDPVVRRRDGAIAYHLASVVDDALSGVTRVVRGRDLAHHSATQVRVQQCLGFAMPRYRHHLLLLEVQGEKLAKLHGAIGADALRRFYSGPELCGVLAQAAELRPNAAPTTPLELAGDFDWQRVRAADRVVRVGERGLVLA